MNKVDALDTCESPCHEGTLEYVVEKEELVMKKYIDNKEKNKNKK